MVALLGCAAVPKMDALIHTEDTMAGKSTKFFRIATEGATSDGRVIDRATLEQMAAAYDPKVYGARINLEHIRGYDPAGPFRAYGDVTALKTEEVDGKLGLYAQLDPTPELVALSKARQKIYCSMEVQPNFADTESAYLVGLAVTDNPASLGCEVLKFSASAKVNPLASRKQQPENLFTEAVELALDFEPQINYSATSVPAGFADSIKRLFSRQGKTNAEHEARVTDVQEAVQTVAEQLQTFSVQLTKSFEDFVGEFSELKRAQDADRAAFSALKGTLEQTPASPARPPATGGNGASAITTDC